MKPKQVLSGLTILWIVFVVLEGTASLIHSWYSRKMNVAAKVLSGTVNYGKTVFMIILAISNVILFMRHVDDLN